MNKAKAVMAIYAFAAFLAMVSIGYGVAIRSISSIIISIVVLCTVFVMGFKMKRKLRERGLL